MVSKFFRKYQYSFLHVFERLIFCCRNFRQPDQAGGKQSCHVAGRRETEGRSCDCRDFVATLSLNKGEKMIKYLLVALSLVLAAPLQAFAQWDFSRHSIPPSDIISGGPPRDGIPALFDPEYKTAVESSPMDNEEMVMGVYINGIARAYPLRILSLHELVNEHYGDKPILVSW